MKRIATITDGHGNVTGLVHGPDLVDQSVRALGRTWRFDYDERLGPLWTKRDGSECKRQNPPKAVWRAWERWYKRNAKGTP